MYSFYVYSWGKNKLEIYFLPLFFTLFFLHDAYFVGTIVEDGETGAVLEKDQEHKYTSSGLNLTPQYEDELAERKPSQIFYGNDFICCVFFRLQNQSITHSENSSNNTVVPL